MVKDDDWGSHYYNILSGTMCLCRDVPDFPLKCIGRNIYRIQTTSEYLNTCQCYFLG